MQNAILKKTGIKTVTERIGRCGQMAVLIDRQEKIWIGQLKSLCKKDAIHIIDKEEYAQHIELEVTDFPIEERKGIFLKIPFLIVSRERSEEKILEAFEKGAEDYMIYPVSPAVARARILRILKHLQQHTGNLQELQNILQLTPNEYKLLSYMMKNSRKVLTRAELLEGAFGENYEGYDRNVDNYMKEIRKKLEQMPDGSQRIETVYGAGYRYMP